MRVGQRTEVGDQIARLPDGQISSLFQISAASVCPALARKIFAFRFSENCGLTLPVPHRHKGRIAIVTNVERNAVDAKMLETCSIDTDGEVVWSWRANAGAKSSRIAEKLREGDGGKRRFTGESSYKP